VDVPGTSPRRFVTRRTWVSTGKAGIPKENRSRMFAVFTPTPGKEVRYALASGSGISRRKSRE